MNLNILVSCLVVALSSAALSACATMEAGSDISNAWEKGLAFTPEKENAVPLGTLTTVNQYPVVLFMHGCSGIESAEMSWGKFLKNLGFVVIIPDSLARRDRVKSCDTSTANYFGTHTTHRLRQQEIDYALEKMQTSPWSDKKNIFLMGHSEGGVAAARTRHGEFRGIIISGWTCTTKYEGYGGIYSPKTVPILSILWNWDRWYPTGGHTSGTCEKSFAGRTMAKHISLDGFNHNTFVSPVAREEVQKFVMENLVK